MIHPVDSGLKGEDFLAKEAGLILDEKINLQSYSDTTAPLNAGGQQLSLGDCRTMCNLKGEDGQPLEGSPE